MKSFKLIILLIMAILIVGTAIGCRRVSKDIKDYTSPDITINPRVTARPDLSPNLSPNLSPELSPGLNPGMSPGLNPGMSPGLSPGMSPSATGVGASKQV